MSDLLSHPRKSNRVLLIDDDPEVFAQLREWLAPFDIVVSVTSDFDQGFDLWEEQLYEVVICQVNAKTRYGFSVLEGVARKKTDTQVIIISEADDMEEVVTALRLGAADFLMKPLSNTVLTHSVLRGLADYSLKQDNRRYREELEIKNRKFTESLRLLREDQEAGRAVQLKLLPSFKHRFKKLRLDYFVLPSLFLSGDFIDYFPVSETKFGFYLADVSGHGAASAFITILLKTMANRLRNNYQHNNDQHKDLPELTPRKILDIANEELLDLGLGKHLAVFCAVIDTENNRLDYCSASHFPPPVLMQGGKCQTLVGQGLPVGLFEDIEYEQYNLQLESEFKLLVFSDGILELIRLRSVAEKEAYLLEMINKGTHTIDAIKRHFAIDGPHAPPDDVAVFTISRGLCETK